MIFFSPKVESCSGANPVSC